MQINGRTVKVEFELWFEDIDDLDTIVPLPTRSDRFIELPNTIALSQLSDQSILSLYLFKEGVVYLYLHLEELSRRSLLMYMFSSPFVTRDQLLELLYGPLLSNYDQRCLEHLVHNKLIYE